MPGSNSLVLTLVQKEGGDELSTLTLSYPSLENATANALSFQLVGALVEVLMTWSYGKAQLTGEKELFEMATAMKDMKDMKDKGKDDMPRGVLR